MLDSIFSFFKKVIQKLKRTIHRTKTINNEPIGEFGLAIIILADLFVLYNVFSGLSDIGQRWHNLPNSEVLLLQSAFLLPLILLTYWINNIAEAKGKGAVSLITLHLLIIFSIPFIVQIFEALQISTLIVRLYNFLSTILGGIQFLVSYVLIFLISLLAYVIIKISQKASLRAKKAALKRVLAPTTPILNLATLNANCIRCNKRKSAKDQFCPHCGCHHKYAECSTCHQITYKDLPYCKECGAFNQQNPHPILVSNDTD